MNIENEIQRISKLILRSAHSELSEEETRDLEEWRKKSSKHEFIYRKLVEQDFSRQDFSRYQVVKNTDDWMMLQKKIMSRARRPFGWRRLLSYAAIMVVGVIVFYMLEDEYAFERQEKRILVEQLIEPGDVQAILELESGEQIELGNQESTDASQLTKLGVVTNETSIVYVEQDSAKIENHVLRVPRGGEYVIQLADGTRVWINSASVLRYPSCFPGKERRVYIEGEAYFQVAKNQKQPFIVETTNMSIQVTGTEFNVMAYKDNDRTETTLVTGSVDIKAGGKMVKMIPNMQVVFSEKENQLITRMVKTGPYVSWKEGVFEFEDLTLRGIAEQLERWYDVEFVFENDEVANIRFTGAVKRMKPIDFILDIVRATNAVNYQIDGKKIILRK